jgi:DNA-binding MarR family transcriptional regulator
VPETQWLDAVEQRAWRALVGTTNRLTAVLDEELQRDVGMPMAEYEVLVILSEMPDRRLRMSSLAEWLHLSPSGLTRRLDRMVRLGLVTREQCAADRRGSFAVLTDLGLARLQEAAPHHLRSVRTHFVDRLSRADLRIITETLAKVVDPWFVEMLRDEAGVPS